MNRYCRISIRQWYWLRVYLSTRSGSAGHTEGATTLANVVDLFRGRLHNSRSEKRRTTGSIFNATCSARHNQP
ncbi:hypothetical protein EMIT0194P_130068 [Pseudomonas serbica]